VAVTGASRVEALPQVNVCDRACCSTKGAHRDPGLAAVRIER
jgi:hypothetical protein